jgi:hypothetical protein
MKLASPHAELGTPRERPKGNDESPPRGSYQLDINNEITTAFDDDYGSGMNMGHI